MVGLRLLCAAIAVRAVCASLFYGREREQRDREIRESQRAAAEAQQGRTRNGWRGMQPNEETVQRIEVRPEAEAPPKWRTVVFEGHAPSLHTLLVVIPPPAGPDQARIVARVEVLDMYCPGDVFQISAERQDIPYDYAAAAQGRESRQLVKQYRRETRGTKSAKARKSRSSSKKAAGVVVRPADNNVTAVTTALASAGGDACTMWTAKPETALDAQHFWSRGELVLRGSRRGQRVYLVHLRAIVSPYDGGAAAYRVVGGFAPRRKEPAATSGEATES